MTGGTGGSQRGDSMSDRELQRLERIINDFKTDFGKQSDVLAKKLDDMLSQFNRLQLDMPDRYIPRREFSERMSNLGEDTVRNRVALEDKIHAGDTELEERVRRLEDNGTWLWRAVAGAFIVGAVTILWLVVQHGLGLR